jgi:hypothetical protein
MGGFRAPVGTFRLHVIGAALGGGAGVFNCGCADAIGAEIPCPLDSEPPKKLVRNENREASAAASSARILILNANADLYACLPSPMYRLELSSMHKGHQCRNYSLLAMEHPIEEVDPHVEFNEELHVYTVFGELVPRSATKVVSQALAEQPFDAEAVIVKNLASWKAKPTSKYGEMIQGLSDEKAISKIRDLWSSANVLGTKLHKRLEAHLNDESEPPDGVTDVEWNVLEAALENLKTMGWVPRRTELSLWWQRSSDSKVVCAGQLDALFSDTDGNLVLVDLKRTDHDLSADVVPFKGKMCTHPLERFYANDFIKYSLQQSIYAVMFQQRTGLEIAFDRRWLLQAHPSKPRVVWTQCMCLDDEARLLLDALD